MLLVSVKESNIPDPPFWGTGNLVLAWVEMSSGAILRSIKSEAEYWCCDSSLPRKLPVSRYILIFETCNVEIMSLRSKRPIIFKVNVWVMTRSYDTDGSINSIHTQVIHRVRQLASTRGSLGRLNKYDKNESVRFEIKRGPVIFRKMCSPMKQCSIVKNIIVLDH